MYKAHPLLFPFYLLLSNNISSSLPPPLPQLKVNQINLNVAKTDNKLKFTRGRGESERKKKKIKGNICRGKEAKSLEENYILGAKKEKKRKRKKKQEF